MSMPQPIHVALVGSTAEAVRAAEKHFRLSAPGIGAAYLASLDTSCTWPIQRLSEIPVGLIHVWVAIDQNAFSATRDRHRLDARQPRYDRGFYDESLPDPCILVDFERSPSAAKRELAELAQKIIKVWYDTS